MHLPTSFHSDAVCPELSIGATLGSVPFRRDPFSAQASCPITLSRYLNDRCE
jgi:hypothetical protein